MEAKSQGLPLATWRPRRADVQYQAKSKALRTRRAYSVSFSPKTRMFVTQEEPVFISSLKARKEHNFSSVQSSKWSSLLLSLFLLFRSAINQMRSTHRREGNILDLLYQFKCNLIQKHTRRHTLNNVWPNVWAPHGLIKLTYKVDHHMPFSAMFVKRIVQGLPWWSSGQESTFHCQTQWLILRPMFPKLSAVIDVGAHSLIRETHLSLIPTFLVFLLSLVAPSQFLF